jgi:hypothetical protein
LAVVPADLAPERAALAAPLAPERADLAVLEAARPAVLAVPLAERPVDLAERLVLAAPEAAERPVLLAPDLAWVEVRDAALRVLVPVALAPLLAAAVVRLAAGLDDEDFEVDEEERFAAGILLAPIVVTLLRRAYPNQPARGVVAKCGAVAISLLCSFPGFSFTNLPG